jgi:hypothetical protein
VAREREGKVKREERRGGRFVDSPPRQEHARSFTDGHKGANLFHK